MHQKEQSVKQDDVKSLEWIGRTAEQGYQLGQHLLHNIRNDNYFLSTTEHEKIFNSNPSSLGVIGAVVEDLLQQINDHMPSNGQLQYGRLRTTRSDSAIRVTIPDVVFNLANFGHLQLGDVVIQVRRENARYDSVSLELPNECKFYTPNGTQGRISATKPFAKFRWDNHLQISSEFEFCLPRLVFSLDKGGEIGRIGEVFGKSNVLENQGRWSGPLHLSLSDVTLGKGDRLKVKLGSVSFVLNIQDLDFPFDAAKARAGPTKNQELASGFDPWKYFLTLAGGVRLQTDITDLSIQDPVQHPFQLARAQFDIDLITSDRQILEVTLNTNYKGLSRTGEAKAGDMFPSQMNLDLSLDNLPIGAAVDVVMAVVELALLGQRNTDPKVLQQLRQEFSAAGTVLRLKSVKVTAHKFHFDLALQVFAKVAANSGFIGDGVLRIHGLKNIMTKLGLQDFPPVAELIKNEKPNVGSECTPFDIAVRPDGMLTVNSCPVLSLASI